MASSVSTALAIRLRQARKQLLKDQHQQGQQQPLPPKQQFKHHHHNPYQQQQLQRYPGNLVTTRATKTLHTSNNLVFDSPHRSHHSAWEGSSEHSASIGASQLALGPDGMSEKAALDHKLRSEKAYKKWVKKHHIADPSSPSYQKRSKRAACIDIFMWLGFAILGVGTVVSFVGLGEKGFRSSELRLLGPILSGFGLAMCFIRIVICCSTCDPHRKEMPSKATIELKKMSVGQGVAGTCRIPHAVAVHTATNPAGNSKTLHVPPQPHPHPHLHKKQTTTPVQVDSGVTIALSVRGLTDDLAQASSSRTSHSNVVQVGRQSSQDSLGSDYSASQRITIDAVIHPEVVASNATSGNLSRVTSSSIQEVILDAGQLPRGGARQQPSIQFVKVNSSNSEPTSPRVHKHKRTPSYLSESPFHR